MAGQKGTNYLQTAAWRPCKKQYATEPSNGSLALSVNAILNNLGQAIGERGGPSITRANVKSFGKSNGGGRRSAPREAAPLIAVFSTITHSHRAIVVDVSATGARLRGRDLPSSGECLEISIEAVRAFGTVVWSDDRECGIGFDSPLEDHEVDALRQRVAAMSGLPPQMKAALDDWVTGFAR